MKKKLPYHVSIRGYSWCVYRYRDEDLRRDGGISHKISSHATYLDARNEAYRLNGEWLAEQREKKTPPKKF